MNVSTFEDWLGVQGTDVKPGKRVYVSSIFPPCSSTNFFAL